MLRLRKLVLAMAAASALTSGMAHALGLGEIRLKSALDQPLEAGGGVWGELGVRAGIASFSNRQVHGLGRYRS